MSRTVKFKFPPAVLDLSDTHKAALIKALGEQIGVTVPTHVPPTRIEHDHERSMWTPSEIPLIAELEDWFYGTLANTSFYLFYEVMAALELPDNGDPMVELGKALGDDFGGWMSGSEWLSKADDSFRLGDIIRMNRNNRERLWKYVADGGTYSKEDLERLHKFVAGRTPSYTELLEAYAVRGVFLGKLRQIADENNLELLGIILSQLPVRLERVSKHSTPLSLRSVGGLPQEIEVPPFTDAEVEAVQYAEQNAARYVTHASEALKWDIQQAVTHARRNRMGSQELRQNLLDKLGEANRDWRRIALTELTDVMANGYLASLPVGARVVGQGAANACPHCQRLIIGKAFTKSDGPGDPETTVWVGKSNVGRKAAVYWPTIPMHPHCRCRWVMLADHQDVDANGNIFILPLEQLIEIYKKKGLIHPEYTMDAGAPDRGENG